MANLTVTDPAGPEDDGAVAVCVDEQETTGNRPENTMMDIKTG